MPSLSKIMQRAVEKNPIARRMRDTNYAGYKSALQRVMLQAGQSGGPHSLQTVGPLVTSEFGCCDYD